MSTEANGLENGLEIPLEKEEESKEGNIKAACRELCKNKTYMAMLSDIVAVATGKKKTSTGAHVFIMRDINGASGPSLTRLCQLGIIDCIEERARKKLYALNRDVKAQWIAEAIEEIKMKASPARWRFLKIPDDLFGIIEGYEDIKYVLRKALEAEKAASVLLVGPPASGKSLFLMELERVGGTIVLAGLGTKAGLRDIILEERPAILLIDELEKCDNPRDLSVLLTWLECGRIIVAKHKDHIDTVTTTKPLVFAACNTTKRLPPELLSRFSIFNLREYTPDEFKRVTIKVLTERENTQKKLAMYIASALLEFGFKDVREAVRISRLAETKEEARKIITIRAKYSLP
jgi:Holliday junction DNA helicase RuvB